MNAASSPLRGDVWLANFDPVVGHEQGGLRPALILTADAFNSGPSRLVGLLPLTTRDRNLRVHVRVAPPEGGLRQPSVIMCDQPRLLSQLRLDRRLGSIEPDTLRSVEGILRRLLDL